MRYFLTLFIIFFAFMTISTHAEETLNSEQQLISLLSNITSMQADFVQLNKDASGQIIRKSTGNMMLLRPGKFRWDVKQPQPQQIIADGKQLWVYDPSLAQATRHHVSKADASTSPAALLSDALDELAAQYQIDRLAKPRQTGLYFKLLPKTKTSMLHWVELHFIDEQLVGMRLMDNLDQLSEFSFQHIQLNPALSPDRFKFLSPPGVEIVNA